MAPGTTFRFSF